MTLDIGSLPIALPAAGGRTLWHLGALLTFKAVSEETGGGLWALEGLADSSMAVPLHAHAREDELWYVLEGTIELTVGERTLVAGPGGFAYIPRDVPHTFRIPEGRARWFGLGVPGGLDRWFFETGVPAPELVLPPPPASAPDVDAIVRSLAEYGTSTLGPPPGRR